ncbi:unnamed protein product [Brachionus calyciflorus]|uniref:5-formyltetrahydrofolate cyclo-ligase n=1 Tax=Brachionus calyciflorus TaxID=104777 RepID=A0A814GKT5_9BILA|nr:unnamed protein product [Brachionus calyciflorus]
MNSNIFLLKSNLRKLMKVNLKELSVEEKLRQTESVINYLLNSCERFKQSKHVALYLAMKHEEIDTIPLIENLLANESRNKKIYVPHIEFNPNKNDDKTQSDMVFYELKNLKQYQNEMNTNNKYNIRQFNDVSSLEKADESLFDLVIVPGLAFSIDKNENALRRITRMGRGKGYYDRFLSKIPNCYTLAIGFNEQYLPLNPSINMELPFDEDKDVKLNQFLYERILNQ